jgi:hypothetical protein
VAQNKALLLKHLHKIFNEEDILWINLTWKAYYSAALAPKQEPHEVHSGGGHYEDCSIIIEDMPRH